MSGESKPNDWPSSKFRPKKSRLKWAAFFWRCIGDNFLSSRETAPETKYVIFQGANIAPRFTVAERSEAAAANAGLLASRIQSSPVGRARPARYSPADWFAQAQRYHQGDGVPANYTEAVRLYQIAASGGDPQARKMLELIFSRPLQGGAIDIAWMQQLANIPIGNSITPSSVRSLAPHGWQRDPSPLYALVPSQWRTPDVVLPRR